MLARQLLHLVTYKQVLLANRTLFFCSKLCKNFLCKNNNWKLCDYFFTGRWDSWGCIIIQDLRNRNMIIMLTPLKWEQNFISLFIDKTNISTKHHSNKIKHMHPMLKEEKELGFIFYSCTYIFQHYQLCKTYKI